MGRRDGAASGVHTLQNPSGMTLRIMSFGGVIQSIEVPDRDGQMANVALGLARPEQYRSAGQYLGCITGRYANRIAEGRFELGGRVYELATNDGPNCLHGGAVGFDQRLWATERIGDGDPAALRLTYTSPDGEEGFPGTLDVTVDYRLTVDDAIRIDYRAELSHGAATVVNLTNHTLFNLTGEGSGSIDGHVLAIAAGSYTPVDATLIPTGEIASVSGTPMDFRTPTPIGERARDGTFEQLRFGRGYDHNWVLDREADDGRLLLAARVVEPGCGRVLEVSTTEPGVQFYGGNVLDGTVVGPSGRTYRQGDGFALETQHFPDSPNQPHFPSTVLERGDVYESTTIYRFGVEA